ncbi:MAG TPA: response regulator [Dehalococcoidia bacterium]|nr:response regulator [Dehalococcoidia bacterium]
MSGELVLVVEDNQKSRKLVRDVLRFHGFATLDAATAAEGLALAREHRPRLILLDIQLPDFGGEVALVRLRAEQATAAIPVVAFTAFAMKGDRERLLAAGFDGYLAKPVDIRALPEQVRGFCAAGVRARPWIEG